MKNGKKVIKRIIIVLAAIVGRMVWGELFTMRKIAGMMLIIGGIILLRMGV